MTKDEVEAVRWLDKAAEQNFAQAQNNLGACFATGRGVPVDYVQAYKWFKLAAINGSKEAEANLRKAESLLTPGQITNAEHMVLQSQAGKVTGAKGDQFAQ